ncbi:MAG: hypothetical protein HPY44_09720 [Armatimonadetes bacterium]|nr:hypothetical protein [Armatimonadota bacterium]
MRVRGHALILGAILVPLNCIWIAQMEMATQYNPGIGGGPFPTTFSLFSNVVLLLVVLSLLNASLGRIAPRWKLNPAELLVIYTMLCIASAVDAIDMIDVLVPMVTHVYRYDDLSAGRPYADEIMPYIPTWFSVTDTDALKYWHEGAPHNFWRRETLLAWLPALSVWGIVLLVMLWVMLCMAALLRTRWINQERLSYPITFIPVQIAHGGHGIFSGSLFWLGVSISVFISLINGLHMIWPAIPTIWVKLRDLAPYFSGRPWNAVGWTPISFYPFAIGLGYLLPPDLLFSTWFFFWLFKAERIMASATGWLGYDSLAPYINEQCFGAYMYVAIFGLWLARRYIAESVARVFAPASEGNTPSEVFHRRLAISGAILGFVALVGFFVHTGMSIWLAAVAWIIYWLISLSVTRMRAELGPPAHDLHAGGPDHMLPIMIGTRSLGTQNLNLITWFYWFNRAYRSHPMPHMLEGFCMARRQGFSERPMVSGVVIGGVLGVISTFVALVYFGYHKGAEAKMAGHVTWFGFEAFNRLRGWLNNPAGPNFGSVGGAGAGLLFAAVLHRMTIQYIWWPLHPLGFAIAGSYSMSVSWCPMLLAWVAKTALLHYGGQRGYMRFVPFFVGLLLGDYCSGTIWPVIGWLTGRSLYSFQQ